MARGSAVLQPRGGYLMPRCTRPHEFQERVVRRGLPDVALEQALTDHSGRPRASLPASSRIP
jgi:hypothetical protein